jgi:8-oxo-dGTP pyrophosphatase MutT (NUDIX family)
MIPAIPKNAATVILLREKDPSGFEVFLLKRHEKSSFMGGNYVYPGGRVDRGDGSLETCALCRGLTPEEARRVLGHALSPEESLAHWIAAVRELFEEAGVLIASDRAGNLVELGGGVIQARFSSYRDQLQKGQLTICRIAQEEKILFSLDHLHYYAHWITPEAQPQRFDTRFFLARHPPGQEASFDRKETTAGIWLTPRHALKDNLEGTVALSPPTLKTLEDLSRYQSIEEVFGTLEKSRINTILPVLTKGPGDSVILFPWDPEYEIFRKGDIPDPANHGRPSREGDHSTRVVLKEGRWLPYYRKE